MDKHKLAGLCVALPALRAKAAQHNTVERLDELVGVARDTGAVPPELFDLATAWGVDIDVAEDSARGPSGTPVRPPLPDWMPFVQVYGCPAGSCSRRWVRRPGVPPPSCEVYGAALAKPEHHL